MKPSFRRVLSGLMLTTALIYAQPVNAHTSNAIKSDGKVELVDSRAGELTFVPDQEGKIRQLAVTGRTQFVREQRFVSQAQLKAGVRATVYYRTPFFGRAYATKVVWTDAH